MIYKYFFSTIFANMCTSDKKGEAMRSVFKEYGVIVVFSVTLIGSLLHMYLFPKGLLAFIYDSISSESVAFAALTLFAFLISLLYAQYVLYRNMSSIRRSKARKLGKISERRHYIDRRTGFDRRKIKVPWGGENRRYGADRRIGAERRIGFGYA